MKNQSAAPSERFRANVSAIPASGHDYRHRAGPKGQKLRWGTTEAEVIIDAVADYKASPMVLSFKDWAELQADKHIRAIPVGGGDPEVPNLKAALLAAEEEIGKLEGKLAADAEARESDQRAASAKIEKMSEEYRALEAETANLRSRLAEAAVKKGGSKSTDSK